MPGAEDGAEARSRLAELTPFLEEAATLRAVLAVVDEEAAGPAHVPARKADILAIVGREPGITVAEIAARHGMKRTVVASSVSRLKRAGEIGYTDGGLHRTTPRRPAGET
jgi:hypothetical protein